MCVLFGALASPGRPTHPPTHPPTHRGMWGIFGKPLKRAVWNTLELHVVVTVCLRFLSFLDGACVACCLLLSTGSHYARV